MVDNVSFMYLSGNSVHINALNTLRWIFILCVRKLLMTKFVCYIFSFMLPNSQHLY